ncbi:peptidase M15A [Salinivibrio sp. SS3]|nr:peptidase M15A [Salinivibrio sp. BNH]
MDAYTLDKLQTVREEMGIPFIITSGYRCANHPAEAKKKQPGTHNMGKAVDIAVRGNEALQLIAVAQCYGFTGIGVAQKGGGRFIHLDDAQAAPRRPRPHIWSY